MPNKLTDALTTPTIDPALRLLGVPYIGSALLKSIGAGKAILNLIKGAANIPGQISEELQAPVQNTGSQFKPPTSQSEAIANLLFPTQAGVGQVAEKSPTLGGLATLGVAPTWKAAKAEVNAPPTDDYTEDIANNALIALTAGRKYLGGDSFSEAFSTDDPIKQGEKFTEGLLSAAPVAVWGVGKLLGASKAYNLGLREARTEKLAWGKEVAGEYKGGLVRRIDALNPDELKTAEDIRIANPFEDAPPAALAQQGLESVGPGLENSVPKNLLSEGATREIANKIIQTKVFERIAPQVVHGDIMMHEGLVNAVKNGALTPEVITNFAKEFDLPLVTSADTLVDAIETSASHFGKHGAALSDAQRLTKTREIIKVLDKDPDAVAAWNAAAATEAGESLSLWKAMKEMDPKAISQGVMSGFRRIERIRRTAGVSGPRTVTRNFGSQSLEAGNSIFESGMAELLESSGLVSNRAEAMKKASTAYFTYLQKGAQTGATATDVLHALPELELMLKAAPTSAQTKALGLVGGKVSGVMDLFDRSANLLAYGNYAQENFFRSTMFNRHLRKNLQSNGLTLDQAVELLNTSPMQLGKAELETLKVIKKSAADSFYKALKYTFADDPVTKTGQSMLKFMQNPIMTAMVHPFPRFLANKYNWITRHNPMNLLDLMDPQFKAMLDSPDVITAKNAHLAVAEAANGLLMFSMVKSLRDSPIAGNKYYELYRVNMDGTINKNEVLDMRPYSPFVDFLGAHSMLENIVNNKPTNLDENEVADMTLGIRRLYDMGLTGGLAAFSAYNNKETRNKAIAGVGAGWYSMGLVPLNTLRQTLWVVDQAAAYAADQYKKENAVAINPIVGMLSDKYVTNARKLTGPPEKIGQYPNLTGKSTVSDKFFGPLKMAGGDLLPNIASAVTGNDYTPVTSRINPYTGKPDVTSSFGTTQLLGLNKRETTKFTRALNEAGLDDIEIRRSYKTGYANDLAARHTAAILNSPVDEKGTTVSDTIADMLTYIYKAKPEFAKDTDKRKDLQAFIKEYIIRPLQDEAQSEAMKEDPRPFILDKVENARLGPGIKAAAREWARDLERQRLIEANK